MFETWATAAVQNVLGSVVKSKDTVRRVILTSSVAGADCACPEPLPTLMVAVCRHLFISN